MSIQPKTSEFCQNLAKNLQLLYGSTTLWRKSLKRRSPSPRATGASPSGSAPPSAAWETAKLSTCVAIIFCNLFLQARSRLYQNENFQLPSSKYAFDSIFQALQDVHTFAPLQTQYFSKTSLKQSLIFVKN